MFHGKGSTLGKIQRRDFKREVQLLSLSSLLSSLLLSGVDNADLPSVVLLLLLLVVVLKVVITTAAAAAVGGGGLLPPLVLLCLLLSNEQ